jgi:hypothetical protein
MYIDTLKKRVFYEWKRVLFINSLMEEKSSKEIDKSEHSNKKT